MNSSSVTLKTIARIAGCSAGVASIVLNNAKGNIGVSTEMRQRVLDVARSQGYKANLVARGMKEGRSFRIGALLQNAPGNRTTHPVAYEFLLGINEGLSSSSYTMCLVRMIDIERSLDDCSMVFQGHYLDGLIVVGAIPVDMEAHVGRLVDRCVWLDANVWQPNLCIRRDEVHAGATAMQAVVDAGYRRAICVTRNRMSNHYSHGLRMEGVRSVAYSSGVALSEFELPWSDLLSVLPGLAESLSPEVALVVLDNYAVQTLMNYFAVIGKRPGTDFALICCDESHSGNAVWPYVDCVGFDRFDYGVRAAEMLLHAIDSPDEPPASVLIRGELLEKAQLMSLSRE